MNLIAALQSAKFSGLEGSRVLLFEKLIGGVRFIKSSPFLPKEWDTQSIFFDSSFLYLVNHAPSFEDKGIMIFDKYSFFKELNPSPLFCLEGLPRPTHISVHGEYLLISAYGKLESEGPGIYIYKLDGNRFRRIGVIGQLFGPIGSYHHQGKLIISDHLGGKLETLHLDFSKKNLQLPKPVSIIFDEIQTPLRIQVHQDLLFVVDHIYHKLIVYDLESSSLIASQSGFPNFLNLPWAILKDSHSSTFYVSNIFESNVSESDLPPFFTPA